MKLFDQKGRLFGKINIVDLLVILMLIFAVVAVGVKFKQVKTTNGGDITIEYTISVEKLRQISVDAIEKEYKNIQDAENKKTVGEIVSVEKSFARELVRLDDGEYKFTEYEDKFDLVITLRTKGSETKEGYHTSSGKTLTVGDTLGISNGYVQTFGEILSVKVVD